MLVCVCKLLAGIAIGTVFAVDCENDFGLGWAAQRKSIEVLEPGCMTVYCKECSYWQRLCERDVETEITPLQRSFLSLSRRLAR
mmetsp:Transcript_104905/g.192298  ORF Transcript_104905/g.192298 Transcript_104905/m.192298 type:complete len:84 (-) Transcript_104905:61-312(-)